MGGRGVHFDRTDRVGRLLLLPSRDEEHDLRRTGVDEGMADMAWHGRLDGRISRVVGRTADQKHGGTAVELRLVLFRVWLSAANSAEL